MTRLEREQLTEVSKPLMSEFVGYDGSNSLLISRWTFLGIIEQSGFTECHQTPMFHSTRNKIRNSNQIYKYKNQAWNQIEWSNFQINATLFWEDIIDSEVFLIIIRDGNPDFKRVLCAVKLVGSGENTEWCSSSCLAFSDLEVTYDEAGQISHHGDTFSERNRR